MEPPKSIPIDRWLVAQSRNRSEHADKWLRQRKVLSGKDHTLHHDDVLCERGNCFQAFPGNVRFNELVDRHKPSYSRKDRHTKDAVIQRIIDDLRTSNVTFLVRSAYKKDRWQPADAKTVRNKVENRLKRNKKPSTEGVSVPSFVNVTTDVSSSVSNLIQSAKNSIPTLPFAVSTFLQHEPRKEPVQQTLCPANAHGGNPTAPSDVPDPAVLEQTPTVHPVHTHGPSYAEARTPQISPNHDSLAHGPFPSPGNDRSVSRANSGTTRSSRSIQLHACHARPPHIDHPDTRIFYEFLSSSAADEFAYCQTEAEKHRFVAGIVATTADLTDSSFVIHDNASPCWREASRQEAIQMILAWLQPKSGELARVMHTKNSGDRSKLPSSGSFAAKPTAPNNSNGRPPISDRNTARYTGSIQGVVSSRDDRILTDSFVDIVQPHDGNTGNTGSSLPAMELSSSTGTFSRRIDQVLNSQSVHSSSALSMRNSLNDAVLVDWSVSPSADYSSMSYGANSLASRYDFTVVDQVVIIEGQQMLQQHRPHHGSCAHQQHPVGSQRDGTARDAENRSVNMSISLNSILSGEGDGRSISKPLPTQGRESSSTDSRAILDKFVRAPTVVSPSPTTAYEGTPARNFDDYTDPISDQMSLDLKRVRSSGEDENGGVFT